MSNYIYCHIVSYYGGNNRQENIVEHLNKTNNSKWMTICIYYYDDVCDHCDLDVSQTITDTYELDKNKSNKTIIAHFYNSGGTVKALEHSYKILTANNIIVDYIGCFEDDVCFKDSNWLQPMIGKLEKYDLVGSFWTSRNTNDVICGVKSNPKPGRLVPILKYKHIYPTDGSEKLIPESMYRWCEDPYITKYGKLIDIFEILGGRLTLAPENEKYDYKEHGINYGEVGFMTRLHLNGFKFIGIRKDDFLCDLNNVSKFVKY
jgi:hypothetical protein